jgi:oligopeptide transport system permease protein
MSARRLVIMLVTLFVIISVTFFISKLLPGTPFADDKLTPQSRQILYEKYGLDEPLIVQYAKYMLQVAQGNLGNSFYFESRPVTQIILEQAPASGVYRGAGDRIRASTRARARRRRRLAPQQPA